jgi:hypothetical protein
MPDVPPTIRITNVISRNIPKVNNRLLSRCIVSTHHPRLADRLVGMPAIPHSHLNTRIDLCSTPFALRPLGDEVLIEWVEREDAFGFA